MYFYYPQSSPFILSLQLAPCHTLYIVIQHLLIKILLFYLKNMASYSRKMVKEKRIKQVLTDMLVGTCLTYLPIAIYNIFITG
jgi:hypothetical protein